MPIDATFSTERSDEFILDLYYQVQFWGRRTYFYYISNFFCLILRPASTSTIYLSSKHFFLPSLHTVEANIDVVPKKTRSPHPWRRQPATAREDTAVPGPTWTPPPSSVEWVNIFLNACQIFLQTTHL